MRIVPAVEAELRREIRDARALDPLISVSALEQRLEKKFKRGFSYRYIAKLADKIARQALVEADRTKIEERLAFTRENYRIVRERLMKIVCWQPGDGGRAPWASEVTEAGKAIVAMDLAILKAEIENGLYKRPLDVIAREFQYEPVPGEVRTVIIASWMRGGLLPAATVHEMVPLKEHAGADISAA
jgi:hypothetical protein